ncbi:MAG: TonB-dependent receptor [Gammaproteobacteria bacterium]|nr:TonB-dependent receptor [Gammaproteobacteria bacterium]MBT7369618.1 TonB-dependent receptor [Gammaproteobacteria bacterium]
MKRFISIMLGLSVTNALANTIEEIVVTADLRQETTMHVASSLTVVTEEVIRSRAAQHFEDIIHSIPNVNYASGSNRARFFQIRGIGERSQFINPVNPSVGVLIDDVDFSGAGTVATMMDVKQVEVLRGPQGTRYGANALGGLINITTNAPTDTASLSFKATSGDYETKTYGLIANSPLGNSVNARLVVESHKSDGYIENDFIDRNDTNGRDEMTLRGRLAWQVSEDWHIDLTLAKIDIDNGYDAFSLDNNRHSLSDEPGFDKQDSTYFAIKSLWQLESMDVEVLVNSSESDLAYGYDEDWSFTGIHPWGYTSTDHYLRDRDTTSVELRLVSNLNSRIFFDSTDWVLGVYSLTSDESLTRQYTYLPADFGSDYDFDTLAVFGQIDTRLSDAWTLSTGLRLEQRDTSYNDSEAVEFSPTDSLWGGKIALEFVASDRALFYASVSRGYKAGGFNTDGSLDADLREFDEEYLIEYELGLKTMLVDDQVALQMAIFYDDRRDQQVKSSVVRVRDDESTEFIDYLGNAAEGTNRGLEVDLQWSVTDSLELAANAGWLDAEFDNFINEFGEDLSGRDQAHAPGYMYSLRSNWHRGPWAVTISADSKDEFYFSDRHAVKSESYTLVNASISYTAANWRVSAWGRNLTDKDYFVRAFGSFGNDPRKFYVTEPYFQFGEPKIVGLTIEVTIGDQ